MIQSAAFWNKWKIIVIVDKNATLALLVFNALGAAFVNWWHEHKSNDIPKMLPGLLAVLVTPSCFILTKQLIHLIDFGLFAKAILEYIYSWEIVPAKLIN